MLDEFYGAKCSALARDYLCTYGLDGNVLTASAVGNWFAWEPKQGTAALAGGVIAGVVTLLVFYSGIFVERRKASRAIRLKQAEGALLSVFRLMAWLDAGVKCVGHVKEPLGSGVTCPVLLFTVVSPVVAGRSSPDDLKLEEMAFLVPINEHDLFQDLLELQAWARTMRTGLSQYSQMRSNWAAWVPLNSKSTKLIDGSFSSEISSAAKPEAEIRGQQMDSLLKSILEHSNAEQVFAAKLERYIQVCKAHFKKDFPQNIQITYRDRPTIAEPLLSGELK